MLRKREREAVDCVVRREEEFHHNHRVTSGTFLTCSHPDMFVNLPRLSTTVKATSTVLICDYCPDDEFQDRFFRISGN